MKRSDAISHAEQHFDSGEFRRTLARRIAVPTESQNPERAQALADYLESEMRPAFEAMGFECQSLTHLKARAPFLFAQRLEGTTLPTVFGYGHGDVIRGLEKEWKDGLSPWRLTESNGRWYGRGMADNKGQHSINMGALRSVLETRGRLGFNAKYLIEMGEETGSTGLRDICSEHKELFAADLLLASDGPRLRADRPTIFLGTRGNMNFDLTIEARKGGHHSGNWGGLISNPGIQLAHAIASIVSATGQIRIAEWVPRELPASVRRALADCEVDGGADGPAIEPWWGEPDLSPAERVFGWCSFEVLAFKTGNPDTPVNAIPPRAWARCQLRSVVGIDAERHPAGAAAPPRPRGVFDGADCDDARRNVPCHAPRSRRRVGAMGGGLDRANQRKETSGPAKSRWIVAQRHLHGRARVAHRVGAALLPGMLAACTQRASAARTAARRTAHHGRSVLGSWCWRDTGNVGVTALLAAL